jgi:predicted MFS family arabinose efflux permease
MGSRLSPSVGLAALGFGNFVIGTGTLAVPGMLPMLAQGIGVPLALAGQLVTAFAVAVCFGAPLLAAATSRADRRNLLVAAQLVFALGHVAAAASSSFAPMLAARVLSAAGAACFTAQAAATAALLVPAAARGRAIGMVFLGWTLAGVIGLPLGAYVGATFGWRAGFALIAAGALLAASAVGILLPAGLRVPEVGRATWRAIFTNPLLVSVLTVTALLMSAGWVVFVYLVPALRALVGASPEAVSLLLAAFGGMGIVGNVVALRFVDRLGAGRVVLLGLLTMLAGHLLWPWSEGALAVATAALLAFGFGGFASVSAQQARLASLAPAHASASIALNSSAVYLGQAVGSVAGGIVIAHASGAAGYTSLAWLSVPLLAAAIGLSLFASSQQRRYACHAA